MSIICLMWGPLLIGINALWLLSLVCLLMGIIVRFIRFSCYLNFIQDPVSHVLLLILVHALRLSCLYFSLPVSLRLQPCHKIL